MFANSSLQPWIDLDTFIKYNTNSSNLTWIDQHLSNNAFIQPCISNGIQVSCVDICNNASYLFDPQMPQNLVTCGIWAELQGLSDYQNVTGPFQSLGLNQTNDAYVKSVRSGITACFESLFIELNTGTSSQDYENGACDMETVISLPYSGEDGLTVFDLGSCIQSLCAPPTMNEDLGGIGVSRAIERVIYLLTV